MKNNTLNSMVLYKANYRYFLTMLFLFPFILKGQDNQLRTWTSIGIEKPIGNWNIGSEFELRQFDFYGKPQRTSLEIGPSYKISKRLDIGAAYKIMRSYDEKYDDYQTRHRFDIGLQGDIKIGRFEFALRERFDYTTKDESDRIKANGEIDTYRINPDIRWRNRLRIRYDIPNSKIEPAVSAESFYQLNNPDGNNFENIRYTLSIGYNITKQHEIVLFGLLNDEFDETEQDYQVFGISYYLDLN